MIDLAIELGVPRSKHFAHSTRADSVGDFVRADPGASLYRQGRGCLRVVSGRSRLDRPWDFPRSKEPMLPDEGQILLLEFEKNANLLAERQPRLRPMPGRLALFER